MYRQEISPPFFVSHLWPRSAVKFVSLEEKYSPWIWCFFYEWSHRLLQSIPEKGEENHWKLVHLQRPKRSLQGSEGPSFRTLSHESRACCKQSRRKSLISYSANGMDLRSLERRLAQPWAQCSVCITLIQMERWARGKPRARGEIEMTEVFDALHTGCSHGAALPREIAATRWILKYM